MNSLPRFRFLPVGLLSLLALVRAAWADPSDLLFTVRIEGGGNTPTLHVTNNSPVLEIERVEITIGDTSKNFDGDADDETDPPGGNIESVSPDSGDRSDVLEVKLEHFGPGKTFAVKVDIDNDVDPKNTGENYAKVFYNNDSTNDSDDDDPGDVANATVTVWAGAASASRTLPDNPAMPTFRGPGRLLTVISKVDSGDLVRGVSIESDGHPLPNATDIEEISIEVAHGDRVQIMAPQEVFKDIHSDYITGSAAEDVELVKDDAEERFVAIGMSVNNVPQTADPTFYDFEITGDTDVQVKWDHYYALRIRQDFSKTQSQEIIAGTPWAGPLESDAAGNPDPPVSKQWVLRGSEPVVKVDGQNVDNFTHPGLDLRYVVKGYRAYGPPG